MLPLFLEYGVDAELYKEIRQICSSGISTLSNLLCTVCVSVTKLKVALVGVFTDLSETSVDGIFDEIVASIQVRVIGFSTFEYFFYSFLHS